MIAKQNAREAVERYLSGLSQGGHPPATKAEIAEVYRAALDHYR